MGARRWEHFPHGSDVGLRGIGPTPKDALEMIATALTAVVTDPQSVRPVEQLAIECSAIDREFLTFEWLNALIFEMDHRKMVFSSFEIHELDDSHLAARISGEQLDRERHRPAVDVKGATMTELAFLQRGDEWVAQCVVDV